MIVTSEELETMGAQLASAREALRDACHIVWYHKSIEHEGCEHHPHFWSIPANRDQDVDLRIGDALRNQGRLIDALRTVGEEREETRRALSDLFGLVENGTLVRDVSRDHETGWALRQVSLVQTLARTAALLAPSANLSLSRRER